MNKGDLGFERISMDDAKVEIERGNLGNTLIVDVRTKEEFDFGHIPGAINLPNEDIMARAKEVLPDKDRPLWIYCRSGVRSLDASNKLVFLGYTKVTEFGGVIDWKGQIER